MIRHLSNHRLFYLLRLNICKPKAEYICLFAILLPIWVFGVLFLGEWDARHESQEECYENAGVDGDPPLSDAAGYYVDAPPHHGFTKVVWMSRVSPKACFYELACPFLREFQVVGKLRISCDFYVKAYRPNYESDYVCHRDFVVIWVILGIQIDIKS